jgi:hypothetical protein
MLAKLTFGCKNERRRPPTKTSSGFIGANCSGGVESACENETQTECIKYQVSSPQTSMSAAPPPEEWLQRTDGGFGAAGLGRAFALLRNQVPQ